MTQEESTSPTPLRRIRSFVIRAGRMTAGQERAWQELWPRFGIDYTAAQLNLDALFGRTAPRVLEIGFGTGDALLAYAQLHPEHDCIGIEVHPPGVGHLLLKIQEAGLTNVRVICHDAVEVLSHSLSNAYLDEVHIFFPDPWHKKRHHKRRLIQTPFIDLLARVVKTSGVVKLGTDWQNYAEQMLQLMDSHPAFENLAHPNSSGLSLTDSTGAACCAPTQANPALPSGYVARPEHRPLTRFERRGHRLGHGVWDLAFRKR
jgi:tRNA (guanine-N7-)-methyltransferase